MIASSISLCEHPSSSWVIHLNLDKTIFFHDNKFSIHDTQHWDSTYILDIQAFLQNS